MESKLGILILCLCLSACGLREQKSQTIRPIAVEVKVMEEETSVALHTYVGEIEEKSSVALSAPMAGRVLAVHVERGAQVQAGQVLLSIDSTQAVNARRSAEAMLRQAEDGYARACVLYKEGGITEQKRVEIETQLTQARSVYASALRMVEDCQLTAPVAGIVSECRTKVGETVAPGLPLVTIINMDGFMVRFSVPEAEIVHIHVGDKASLQVPASGLTNLSVTITDKSLIPNRLAHTYEVVGALQKHADLLPGMMAKVQMESDIVSGFILPQECIQILPDGAKVWVVENGYAIRKNITIGQYIHEGILITDGISLSDKVITRGYQKLWQGAEITY